MKHQRNIPVIIAASLSAVLIAVFSICAVVFAVRGRDDGSVDSIASTNAFRPSSISERPTGYSEPDSEQYFRFPTSMMDISTVSVSAREGATVDVMSGYSLLSPSPTSSSGGKLPYLSGSVSYCSYYFCFYEIDDYIGELTFLAGFQMSDFSGSEKYFPLGNVKISDNIYCGLFSYVGNSYSSQLTVAGVADFSEAVSFFSKYISYFNYYRLTTDEQYVPSGYMSAPVTDLPGFSPDSLYSASINSAMNYLTTIAPGWNSLSPAITTPLSGSFKLPYLNTTSMSVDEFTYYLVFYNSTGDTVAFPLTLRNVTGFGIMSFAGFYSGWNAAFMIRSSRSDRQTFSPAGTSDFTTFLATYAQYLSYFNYFVSSGGATPDTPGYSEGYDEGYVKGYEQGKQEGEASGHDQGYNEGYAAGRETGWQAGYFDGINSSDLYDQGYEYGYTEGYNNGLNKGVSEGLSAQNPLTYFLDPVKQFFDTKFFGNFSFGSIFGVVMFVILALIFLKMFGG